MNQEHIFKTSYKKTFLGVFIGGVIVGGLVVAIADNIIYSQMIINHFMNCIIIK